VFDRGGLDRLGRHVRAAGLGRRAVVVSDATVAALYAPRALASLARAGVTADLIAFPPGERSKTLATAGRLFQQFAALALDRETAVIALGGGVVGDLGGFAAATYLRGLPLVHVPTTTLSQADAAIGGKTAVDLAAGKNLVGAFHAPRLVLADPETLGTLPRRGFRSGLAEVAKVAFALEPALLRLLESESDAILARDPAALDRALALAARAKARVVSADERESGRRMILNYGHTVGHALEALGAYRRWTHGEAVAHGIRAAARLATRTRAGTAAWEDRQRAALATLGFGEDFPRVSIAALWDFLARDKKARNRAPAFVLTARVGVARVRRSLSRDAVVRALTSLGAAP